VVADAFLWLHRSSIHNAKTVTTLHNYVKEDYKYGYNPLKAFILQRVWNLVTSKHNIVVVLSKDAIRYYSSFWKNKNITYAYNGIPQYSISNNKILYQDKKNTKLGLIGSSNTSKVKGFEQVIVALSKMPNFSLFVAGGGSEMDHLRDFAKVHSVDDRVFFLGLIDDIDSFICSMDILAVTSYSEGFSLVLQEIVRAKRSIICSNIAIFRELYSDDEVTKFKLDDRDSFVSSVKFALNHKDMIEKAYLKFSTTYRSMDMADRYMEIYSSMLYR
jgi:glycosyltransferase involved in cell wall biosynthesis